MSALTSVLNVIAALVALWAILQLAVIGMYNYQFYRLVNLPSDRQRQRLGGLMQIELLEVSPHALIDGLQEGETFPVVPRDLVESIALAIGFVTVVGIATTLAEPYTMLDLVLAIGFPVWALLGSGAFVAVHAFFTGLRLWRSDAEQCGEFYEILSNADNDSFPRSF